MFGIRDWYVGMLRANKLGKDGKVWTDEDLNHECRGARCLYCRFV